MNIRLTSRGRPLDMGAWRAALLRPQDLRDIKRVRTALQLKPLPLLLPLTRMLR